MSKLTKRKITVESTTGNKQANTSNSNTNKDFQRRQSVFERLGTKTGASISVNTSQQPSGAEGFCRHWNQNGTCPYGKSCVFVSTHTLISPSKRALKKDLDPKQARSIEEGLKLEGLKRLHSTVVKRGSPELNWESWDHSELEYEDEKALEKRRQLLQRELELQMKREETEEHHSRRRHNNTTHKKGLSSSSSTSVSSTSSESSSSSDDSSSDSSSTSGVAGDSKRRRSKTKKSKRASVSSASDTERKKIREPTKSMHKDRSPSNISRKSAGSKDKRAFTPPRKPALSVKVATRKKSPSPSHRRHNTPTNSSKKPPSTKASSSSRHNQSPRPTNKRSTSLERKDKHKSSLSPRARSKQNTKERSPRRQDPRPRRKDSPDTKPRNASRSRQTESRVDDRKKDDDRSRNKDDRRLDRKPTTDRDKRDHEDNRSRDKAREAAREKEREEALERCRERQREREQLAKEKERNRERERDNRDKEVPKARDYEKNIPPLMSLSTHNQSDRKIPDRERDKSNKDRKDRDKDRDKDKERDRDRLYERNIDKTDRNRPLEKERLGEKISDRDRGGEKERPRERDALNDRSRDKADKDRNFERDRNYDRNTCDPPDRPFDRDKDRVSKAVERNRDRDFDRDKERNYDRVPDNRRSFDKGGDRDKTSLEKDRGIARDRALERVMELRERNKSLERGRASDGERSVDRNRERFDREGRFDRRTMPQEEKAFDTQFESRRDRSRYGGDSQERGAMFKDLSPSREDARGMRHPQTFGEDRRMRGSREMRGGWEGRGTYDDSGPAKSRDWDYPDSRREWDARNRHGDWEEGVEGDEWGRYGGGEWEGGWREEWQHRPPRHPSRDDQTIVSSNHIVVTNIDDSSGRRPQTIDPSDKDLSGGDFKKDTTDIGTTVPEGGGHKRAREENDGPGDAKKARQEEPSQCLTANLEEVLSDISDDPDEILNREDIDIPMQDTGLPEVENRRSPPSVQASVQDLDHRLLEDRPSEEENIANLNDFEEISDEELEEEARANKGLGDALGVDWASLVKESRPKPTETQPGAARRRWQPYNILARIGVSLQYAGQEVFDEIQQKLTENKDSETEEKTGLLHPVASLHMSLKERQARRRNLFAASDIYKRALSARADIAIRRQLCNLPVVSLEMQQSAGFCQWVV